MMQGYKDVNETARDTLRALFVQVKVWLQSLSNPAFDIEGFELTVLGESKALAVRYSQTVDNHNSTSYYVVAPLPKKYRHGNAYKNGSEFFGAGKNFYLSVYFQKNAIRESVEVFHPFGANYILREIEDLNAHRIPGELPHRIPVELQPL